MKPDIWHDPLFLADLKGGGQGGSASGPIVRFRGDGSPLRSLRIGIDPVQDLHGYDSPWPAGGGKNKLAPAFSAGTTKTASDVNYLFNSDGTVSVSGTCSDAKSWQDVVSYFSLPAGTYTLSGGAANGIYLSLRTNNNIALATSRPEPETFTISETTTVRVRACVLANTVVPSNTVLRPQLESGSTATPYAPYANLCPISGWDEANLWRTGKNLLELTAEKMTSVGWNREFPISVKAGNYVISCENQFGPTGSSNYGASVSLKGSDDTAYATLTNYTFGDTLFSKAFTISSSWANKVTKIVFAMRASGTTFEDIAAGNIQLELSSTPTSYSPYTGTSYPITIPTPPGTVYGGYIQVAEDGSAELVVDRAMASAKKVHFPNKATGTVMDYRNCSGFPPTASMVDWNLARQQQMSNMAKIANANTEGAYGNYVAVVLTLGSDPSVGILRISEDLYQSMSDDDAIEVVYKLLNPLTYPLSDITVQTLAGTNVMWADCGDIAVEWAGGKGFGKEAMLAWVMHR